MAEPRWTSYQIFLAVLLVATGSVNTLAAKWADKMTALGRPFAHPFLQAVCMFLGEFACLGAYFLQKAYRRWRHNRSQVAKDLGNVQGSPSDEGPTSPDLRIQSTASNASTSSAPPRLNPFVFLPATLCDMTATSIMYVGLNLTNAASFQMLRGSVIIFTGLLSVAFLRSILTVYRWIGMVSVVIGLVIVGVADIVFHGADTGNRNGVISGDLLIIIASVVVSVQMVYEQKFVTKYNVHPLLAVGLEGMFGTILLSLLLIPMYFIRVPAPFTEDPAGRLENVLDAFDQIRANLVILVALGGTIVSIAFFNFAGISVTKELNATTRMVLDSVRVLVIWAVSLAVGWQSFILLQLLGFAILIFGMCVYNDIFFGPFLREYVAPWLKRRGLCPGCCWRYCCPVVDDGSGFTDSSFDDRSGLINQSADSLERSQQNA